MKGAKENIYFMRGHAFDCEFSMRRATELDNKTFTGKVDDWFFQALPLKN